DDSIIERRRVMKMINEGDDPIACLNKAMAFLIGVASLRFPLTNNQLRTSLNLRNQATIQDGRVTVQQVQGRPDQIILYWPMTVSPLMDSSFVVPVFSLGDDPIACLNKAMAFLIDEEQLAILIDSGVPDGQAIQTIIPNNAALQTEDLDTYDSD
nr:hypothetical protein [Tanacetum cinerariifolium]